MTACFATASTTRSRASIRAGTQRISLRKRSSPALRRIASPPARSSVSVRPRRRASSRRRLLRSRFGQEGRRGVCRDEAPRPDTTIEMLAKLRPAFREGGTITAGNAPGLNSGAAAMIVADRAFAEMRSVEPMARLVAFGVAAVEPGMFGLGPVQSTPCGPISTVPSSACSGRPDRWLPPATAAGSSR